MEQVTALDQELRVAQQAHQSIAGLRQRLAALESFSNQLADTSNAAPGFSDVEETVSEIKRTLARTESLGRDVSDRRSQVETLESLMSTVQTHAQRLPNQEAGEISAGVDIERIEEIPDDVLEARLSIVVSLLRAEQERPDSSAEQYTQKVDLSRAIREEALDVFSSCVDGTPDTLRSIGVVPVLLTAINEGVDAPGRTHAVYTLRLLCENCPDIVDAEIVATMTRALKDGSADTRYHAVYTLQTAAKRIDLTPDAVAAIRESLTADAESTRVAALNAVGTIASASPGVLSDHAVRRLHQTVRWGETGQESAFEALGAILRTGSGRLSTQAEAVLRAELDGESTATRRLATLELLRTPNDLVSGITTGRLSQRHFEAVLLGGDDAADSQRISEDEFEEYLSGNEEMIESALVPALLGGLEAGDSEQVSRCVKWLLVVVRSGSVPVTEEMLRGVYLGVVHDQETGRKNALRALADVLEDFDDGLVDVVVRATVAETGPATIFEAALRALFLDDVGVETYAGRIVARSVLAFQPRADGTDPVGNAVDRLFNDGEFDSTGVPEVIAAIVAGTDRPQRELLEPVTAALHSKRSQVRESAVAVCREVQKSAASGLETSILAELLELESDPDTSVRGSLAAALPALSRTDHSDVASAVRSLVTDEKHLVRVRAISNLSDIELDWGARSAEVVFESLLENTKPQDVDAGVVRGLYAERSFRILSHRAFRELVAERPALLTESSLEELLAQTDETDMGPTPFDTVDVAVSERPDLCDAAVVECTVDAVRRPDRSVRVTGFQLAETLVTHRSDLIDEAFVEAVLDRRAESADLKFVLDILDSISENDPTLLTEAHVCTLVELTTRLRDQGVLSPTEQWSSAELFAEIAEIIPPAIDSVVVDLLVSYFERDHSVVQRRTSRALQTIAEHVPAPVLNRRDELIENAGAAGHLALSEAVIASDSATALDQRALREQVASPMCPETAKTVFVDSLARLPSQRGLGTAPTGESPADRNT